MTPHEFRLWFVRRRLDNRLVLAEALGCPEASRLAPDPGRAAARLRRAVRRLLHAEPVADLHRRLTGGDPTLSRVEIALEPPPGAAWRGPLSLTFDAACWGRG